MRNARNGWPRVPSRDRFFLKFTRDGNGCWLWHAQKTDSGYGVLAVNRKNQRAHRYSWLLHFGEIPAGVCVLHRCDVRACVNPEHLFLGTHADNAADRNTKGRTAKGDRSNSLRGAACPAAKLTDDLVRRIRLDTRPIKEIRSEYGIGHATVSYVRNRKTWRHVT